MHCAFPLLHVQLVIKSTGDRAQAHRCVAVLRWLTALTAPPAASVLTLPGVPSCTGAKHPPTLPQWPLPGALGEDSDLLLTPSQLAMTAEGPCCPSVS